MKRAGLLVFVLVAVSLLAWFDCGTARAQTLPNLSIWENTWFKVKLTATVYRFEDIGQKPKGKPVTAPGDLAYLKIVSWSPVDEKTGTLALRVYPQVSKGVFSPDVSIDVGLSYFAGSDLNFVCYGQADTGFTEMGFLIFFKGKQDKSGNFVLNGKTYLKTLAGFYLEEDDVPESTERWAGSAALKGAMVPESKVPPALLLPNGD